MGREQILIHYQAGQVFLARLCDERLVDIDLSSDFSQVDIGGANPESDSVQPHDIVSAKILRMLKGGGGFLVSLGGEQAGFVSYKPGQRIWSATEQKPVSQISEGMSVFAQVTRLGLGRKGPRLSREIAVPGRYAVYLPFRDEKAPQVACSAKLSPAAKRDLKDAVSKFLEPGEGVIIRSGTGLDDLALVAAEVEQARASWRKALAVPVRKGEPVCRWRDDPCARALRNWAGKETQGVSVNAAAKVKEIEHRLAQLGLSHIRVIRPKTALNSALPETLRDEIDRLMARRVAVGRPGLTLTIDKTEALTAIDVDGGGAQGEQAGETSKLEDNLCAAREIARQIRLRDIGGLIVIDFISMERKESGAKVEAALRRALESDPCAIDVGRFSRFGTLELTRQRSGSGMLDCWLDACPTCEGLGMVPGADYIYQQIMNGLHERGGAVSSAPVVIRLGSGLFQWRTANATRLDAALAAEWGMPVRWYLDERLGAHQFEFGEHALRSDP